jgi:periplasmic copper chaperone A
VRVSATSKSLVALRLLRTAAVALALAAAPAHAQVKIGNAWVRGAVPGQLATGAFLDITSTRDAALIKAESPVAATVEVHAMEMQNNMMTMREAPKVDLPAGKQVRLAPGGFHIMLMDLKQPLKNGETVPLKLTIEYSDKTRETVEVQAQVRRLGSSQEYQHKH